MSFTLPLFYTLKMYKLLLLYLTHGHLEACSQPVSHSLYGPGEGAPLFQFNFMDSNLKSREQAKWSLDHTWLSLEKSENSILPYPAIWKFIFPYYLWRLLYLKSLLISVYLPSIYPQMSIPENHKCWTDCYSYSPPWCLPPNLVLHESAKQMLFSTVNYGSNFDSVALYLVILHCLW